MSGGDTTGGPTGRRRGHLRGVRGQAGQTPDGSTTTRRDDDETHDEFELGGGTVDDNSFSVPDLLATDALLDRLGRHEATGGDLADAVARLLDSYALHADPETAGVRPVELPDLDAELEHEPAHVPAPRVLLARRRTIQRLGRGTVAAAAVLTLLGGTAAAAATSVSPLGGPGGSVSASIASQLPGWFPDTVFSVFAGSPTERAQREIVQAQAAALAGDSEGAKARLKYLQRQLDDTSVDPQVVQQVQQVLAALEDDDLDSVAGSVPTGSPTGSPTASPSPTGTSLVDVATVTPTASPNTWRVPLQPGRTTGTATSAPTTPSPSVPTAGDPATGGTPPRTSTPVTSSPPVVQNPPAGGGTGARRRPSPRTRRSPRRRTRPRAAPRGPPRGPHGDPDGLRHRDAHGHPDRLRPVHRRLDADGGDGRHADVHAHVDGRCGRGRDRRPRRHRPGRHADAPGRRHADAARRRRALAHHGRGAGAGLGRRRRVGRRGPRRHHGLRGHLRLVESWG